MPGDVKEDIEASALARRNLKGCNLFENLGDPIKDLIIQVEKEGKNVDESTLELLQHITVKQLAKIFDMLGDGQDPETILAWLKRRARKNKAGKEEGIDERKRLIQTGAERDPIAFYKALEAANQKKQEEFEQMEEERQQLRLAKTKEREKARAQKEKELEEAKKALEDEGGWWKATDYMPDKDKDAINNAFEKFATKTSEFDNSNKDQDGEWWKKDPYRRDWERNKGKGKKWTAVMQGAKERATEPELAVREEFYKGNDWWKADKYKRDWEATKDAEWWKEEPYIKDWQQNKHDGARWKAADEESGLESEGHTYPAPPEEQKRREDWYKANGPRGVVKKWNAATEGDPEKCSVPEKDAREEFYRNGDWWKNDDARQAFKEQGLDADALNFAGQPQDTEWWKQEPYREDYFKNGDKGKKWAAATEGAGIDGTADKNPAPEVEKKRREDWYKNNWWKQPEYKDDWKKNGKNGKMWKAPSEDAAKAGTGKPVGEEEKRHREDWYKNGGDDEWWKKPQFVEDYFQKGPEGRHWGGKTEEDGNGGRAQENPAAPEEKQKREDWYRQNWWKQPKYTDDFHKNGALGAAWKAGNDGPNTDKEWWKQPPFIENWSTTMKPKTKPDDQEWWKQPEYIEDFNLKGPEGKKWTAADETHGIEGKGDKPASPEEQKKREDWYRDNWWKAPQYAFDWAKKGPSGKRWKAASKAAADDPKKGAKEPCSEEEEKARDAWYRPVGDMWRALGEEAGFAKKAAETPCTQSDALNRDEWYRNNWWKAPEYIEDWKKNGAEGKKWPAGNEAAGKAGEADKDPASDEEKQKRDDWYRNNADNEWWKEPQYIEDWGQNGQDGAKWNADNRPNADKSGGKEHPCTPEEKEERDEWYKKNWWKTPQAKDDWDKNGAAGPVCGRKLPTAVERQDPEATGDDWWKKPEFIEDWMKKGDAGKHWTAEDPVAAAAGQGHKKPATDPEKEAREQWYKDNWWKAPSCVDDWAKNGAAGKKWGAVDPEATKANEGDTKPASDDEKDKREDWYRKHGDADEWWKRPEFIEDYAKAGPAGKKWTAGNPTAGALGQGQECPASGPEKKKREDWYKDNWWKAPEYSEDWAKGPAGEGKWKKDATPEEEKARDAWFRENQGEPLSPEEQAERDDWFKKHPEETSDPQLDKREEWFKKQLSDDDKARRMDWLRDRAANDKCILEDELPEALAAINEGQKPTDKQVKAILDAVAKARKAEKDDFGPEAGKKKGAADDDDDGMGRDGDDEDGMGRDDDEEKPKVITQDEFLKAVAETNMYVPPDEDELEMQAEEERVNQEKDEMTRQEEEAAYLAMDAEEEIAKQPEEWQKKYVDPENPEWWKRPEFIESFQKDPEDAEADWRMDDESGKKRPISGEEAAEREQWYKDNWWKAPKFSQEWRRDDDNGDNWKKQSRPEEEDDGAVREDDETPEASPEEIKEREDWFRNAKNPERQFKDPEAKEDEWWKTPKFIEDFQEGGDDCMRDADEDEKKKREDWFKDNWWKAPKHIDSWNQDVKKAEDPKPEDDGMKRKEEPSAEESSWMRAANPEPAPGDDEDGMKRDDDEAPQAVTPEQAAEREKWYRQATAKDDDDGMRRKDAEQPFVGEKFPEDKPSDNWTRGGQAPADDDGMQRKDEEPQDDDGMQRKEKPSAAQSNWTRGGQAPAEDDGMQRKDEEPFTAEKLKDEEPFVGEKLKDEEPFTGEKMKDEDPFVGEKLKEEDPFVGEKLKDEEPFVGEKLKDEDPFVGEKLKDEDPFVGEKLKDEEPFDGEKLPNYANEDDEPEDPEWEDPVEEEPVEEAPVDEEMEDEDEQEEQPDEEAAWNDDLDDDEEEEEAGPEEEEEEDEEGDDNEHQDDEDLEAELEAALEEQEQEWEEDDEDDEEDEQAEPDENTPADEVDEDDEDPEQAPEPWMLPLPEVTNNIYLKSYFPVLKWNPAKNFGVSDRRVWVVDHFSKSFYCLDGKGKLKKQHDANKLLQLERNVMDPRRARLMFFDAPRSYEILFPSNEERERFYETGSSIRPAIRVYAPSLTKPDTAHDGATTTTTIDGIKENAVVQKVPNPFKKTGEMIDRELSGRCKINSSKIQDEPVSVWTGTLNMCGASPPKSAAELGKWIPKGKYDIYAVGTQETSYQKEEGEWFSYIQEYLGKDYLTLATKQLWDITIIVLCRKKCLLKITNVEGSTKATLHKEKCGMKGAAGICLKYHNTSMAFISCHLAARLERTKMRKVNIEEICNQIQLGNRDADLTTQFHHVFLMGDLNYRVEMEHAEAEPLIQANKFVELLNQDQLTIEMRESGLLAGFKEAPITFAPTYRFQVGTKDYMRDRGRAPSYCDRILHKSMGNTTIRCTGYNSADVRISEHMPVWASYVVRCIRPHMSCFHRDQEPRPQFEFSSIKFLTQEHLMFRKPLVMMYTPFSEHAHKGKPMKVSTMTPEFTGEHLPEPVKCTVQMTEYLEKHALTIIFRDQAEPREDKMFRGAAVMELKDRVVYDEAQELVLDVQCLGRKVGTVQVNFKVTNYGYTPPPGGAPGRVPEECLMDERTDNVDE
eukprot:TRINITY_DN394_c0_g2_i9.p1 TRINITY_DN394_c0_g2~~TRINITY_DN394_c0_g2_i9.p1  ORF type:complete len:2543 (+),score=1190.19 TRINITY_DN394_c0_g2_i9:95-7723(+)